MKKSTKLELKKETLRSLENRQDIAGGGVITPWGPLAGAPTLAILAESVIASVLSVQLSYHASEYVQATKTNSPEPGPGQTMYCQATKATNNGDGTCCGNTFLSPCF